MVNIKVNQEHMDKGDSYLNFLDNELMRLGMESTWYYQGYWIPDIHQIVRMEKREKSNKAVEFLYKLFKIGDHKVAEYVAKIVSEPTFFNNRGHTINKNGLKIRLDNKEYKTKLEEILEKYERVFEEPAELWSKD